MQPRMPKLNEVPGDPPSYRKRYQYEDINGSFSQPLYFASEYEEGFAIVQETAESGLCYRDLLGKITTRPTMIGKTFYKFYTGTLALKKIPDEYWESATFCRGVKDALIDKEKEKAIILFKQHKKISKQMVESRINKLFDYINKKHKKAIAALEKEKRKKRTKGEDDYKEDYSETMAYLNTL